MDTTKKNTLVYAQGFIDGFIETFVEKNQDKTPQLKEYCDQINSMWALVSSGVTELVRENNDLVRKLNAIKNQIDV